jgi:hypothetical protein
MTFRLSQAGALVVCLGLAACASGPDAKDPSRSLEPRDTTIVHEECDITGSSAKSYDANGDGRPELVRVFDGGREVCRAVDFNLDGIIDLFVYYDERGQERRRESGFGRDAVPNEVAIYENGQLVRKERETNNDRKIDTWDHYEGGRLVREERDSTGDGFVDQWWTFNRPDDEECAIVTTDGDGDGKPDEASALDICADKVPVKAKESSKPKESPAPAGGTSEPGPAASEKESGSPAPGAPAEEAVP